MAVLHAEPPVRIPEPSGNPNLRLLMLDRVRIGGSSPTELDSGTLSRLVSGPVVLGVRKPAEFRAQLRAESLDDHADLYAFADIAMREADDTRAVVLRAYAGPLTLALITVLDPLGAVPRAGQVPAPTLFWSIAASSGDATARADVLDFLRVLHQEHTLRIINAEQGVPIGSFEGSGGPFDADLERDSRFVTDVAILEEWSGMLLPLPLEVSAVEVARIQQTAQMVREREVLLQLDAPISATVAVDPAESQEDLILEQDFGVLVFGFDVPLGVGRARFPPRVVSRQPDPALPGKYRVTLGTPRTDGRISFSLDPPPGRVRSKRTLRTGEQPGGATGDEWNAEWLQKEREADRELRSGEGVRFLDEKAFFAWLDDPDQDLDA